MRVSELAGEALTAHLRPAPGGGDLAPVTREVMLQFLDLMQALEQEADRALPLRQRDPYLHMTLFLVRQHLDARLVTTTALAAASRAPHATAIRRIQEMERQGLIVRRPRTRSRKSSSLHPSQRLLDDWYDYARRARQLVGRALAPVHAGTALRDYFFARSYRAGPAIRMPTVCAPPIALQPPLRILAHADPTFMAMEALKRQFEHMLGVPIGTRALSIDRLRAEAIRNSAARVSHYDVIAVDLPWVGEFASGGVLEPLDALIAKSGMDTADFYAAGWHGARFAGRQYGIPIQTTPELFLYRTDLFAEAGLEPPRTTDQVVDAARRLHRPNRGVRGIAWNAARGTAMGHTFLMVMGAFGRPVLNLAPRDGGFDAGNLTGERLRPMIATDEGRMTAEYLLELLAYSPLNILNMAWYERVAAYTRGEVAMAYGYTLLAPYFEYADESPAHGRTGFLPHPTGPNGRPIAPVGGYLLGIPRNIAPTRLEPTWQAVQFLTSPEAAKLYILNGSLVSPRASVAADPEVREVSPIIGEVDAMERTGLLQVLAAPAGAGDRADHHDLRRGDARHAARPENRAGCADRGPEPRRPADARARALQLCVLASSVGDLKWHHVRAPPTCVPRPPSRTGTGSGRCPRPASAAWISRRASISAACATGACNARRRRCAPATAARCCCST